jgi:hypothetical protein
MDANMKTLQIKNSQLLDVLLLSSLISYLAEFPQDNPRGNIGIEKNGSTTTCKVLNGQIK